MAEVTITIRTEDAEESARAVNAVTAALKDMDVEVRASTRSTVEAEEAQSSSIARFVKAVLVHEALTKAISGLVSSAKTGTLSTTALGASISTLNTKITSASKAASTFARVAIAGLRLGVIGLAAAISVKLVLALGGLLQRMGATGAAAAVTKQAFDNLAKSIDETAESLTERLSRATLGTVDDFRLMRVGSLALATEIAKSADQLEEMARVSTILAIAVGKDAAEGFDVFATAIARHNPVLLKQLNLVVDSNDAYKAYAESINKTVGELDGQERKTAFTNATLRAAQLLVLRLGIDTNNLAVIQGRAATATENLRQAMNREVAEAEGLIEFTKEWLALTIAIREEQEKLAPTVGLLADAFFTVGRALLEAATSAATFDQAMGRLLAERIFQRPVEVALPPDVLPPGGIPLPPLSLPLPPLSERDIALVDEYGGMLERLTTESLPGVQNRVRLLAGQLRLTNELFAMAPEQIGLTDEALTKLIATFPEGTDLLTAFDMAIKDSNLTLEEQSRLMALVTAQFGEMGDVTREQAAAMTAATTALRSAVTEAFVEMGEAIGTTLAGLESGMESFGSSIIKILGTLLQTLGRILIAFGTAGLAIQAFAFNPVGAIVAGVALIALGAALAGAATAAVASGLSGGGGGFSGGLPAPPRFQDGGRVNIIIQIVARDLDREGGLRIVEEINTSGQLDRPIQLDTALVRID